MDDIFAIEQLMGQLSGFESSATGASVLDLREEDLVKAASTLADETKRLPKLRVRVCLYYRIAQHFKFVELLSSTKIIQRKLFHQQLAS